MPDTNKLDRGILQEAFEGKVERAVVPLHYRIGLFLVTVMMVLLPLVYLGIIGFAGYLVYWHATANITIMSYDWPLLGKLLLYVTPIVAGVFLPLFMLKPLFARPARRPEPVSLNEQDEPLLFNLIEHVCEQVGAPMPSRVDVNCDVNASASFRRGVLSFFGNDLVLTIGLPLVAGLNLRQFAGVLSHEFGHFVQGTGMRFSYVIRRINHWFARVVFERDAWDEWLTHLSNKVDIRIGIIFYIARFFIWVTRKILWVFYLIANIISSYMLRQMEYDADHYEIHLVGSKTFRSTARKLPLLAAAKESVLEDLARLWDERRLPDRLPQLIVTYLDRIPEEKQEEYLNQYLNSERTIFDTHPADQDRINRAYNKNQTGIFQLDLPAVNLFQDFYRWAERATYYFYRDILGDEISKENLIPADRVVERQMQEEEDLDRMNRYFQGYLNNLNPPFPDGEARKPPEDPEQAIAELRETRKTLEPLLREATADLEQFVEAENRILELKQLEAVRKAKLQFEPVEWGLNGSGSADIREARSEAESKKSDAEKSLERVNTLLKKRLNLALRLSSTPEVADRIDVDNPQGEKYQQLLDAIQAVREHYSDVLELNDRYIINTTLLSNVEGNEQHKPLIRKIRKGSHRLRGNLQTLRRDLARVSYPFEHADGDVTLGKVTVNTIPRQDQIGEIFDEAGAAISRVNDICNRLMGRLVARAAATEEAIGLPPLPDIEEEPPSESEEDQTFSWH